LSFRKLRTVETSKKYTGHCWYFKNWTVKETKRYRPLLIFRKTDCETSKKITQTIVERFRENWTIETKIQMLRRFRKTTDYRNFKKDTDHC
jgi:alpha-L-fucosidase